MENIDVLNELIISSDWGTSYHKKKINNIKRRKNQDAYVWELAFHKKELKKEELRLEAFNELKKKLEK